MNKFNILITAALLLIASVAQAAEVVGVVGYMSGSLIAKRADGTVKIMGKKSEVLAGDTLGTAKNSYAQIKMNDGGKMTLRPNSKLKIVDYQFDKQEPKSDSAVFDLIRGGMRSVTGLIGKRGNPDAYKMQTRVATVGIRGTDFSSRLCATPNCMDDAATSARPQTTPPAGAPPPTAPTEAPPGLYVTVHSGQVIVAQPAGNTLSLGRGETGFANTAALTRLPAPPAFMKTDTKQTDAIEATAAKSEDKAGNNADDGKANAKSDKDKDSGKADKEKDGDKTDQEKDGAKSDKEKDGAKPEEGKDSAKSDEGKSDASADTGNDTATPDAGNDAVATDAGNTASPDPSVNKGGCVVQ